MNADIFSHNLTCLRLSTAFVDKAGAREKGPGGFHGGNVSAPTESFPNGIPVAGPRPTADPLRKRLDDPSLRRQGKSSANFVINSDHLVWELSSWADRGSKGTVLCMV